ncbi:MAG: hypothetical protein OES46_16190 [Gammaproteobacteria bacterium]|nr:hypothetical protein [Gammaproteobacteria bacterium]
MVFADTNESGELHAGEDVVGVGQKLRWGLSHSYRGNYIICQPIGMTKSQNGTFGFYDSTTARTVILYKTSRMRTSTT